MSVAFLTRLTTASTLGELPGHRASLQLSDRGRVAGELFGSDERLPGILLGDDGVFRTAVSRRYYLDAIGRYCGMDLYHPRPLRFMMARYDELGGPLVLHSSTPIAEAVRRGLDRPRELLYEPLVVAEEARPLPPLDSVRLVDFEDLLIASARLTTLRAEQMRHILSSVREGLLLVDRAQRIAPEYSESVDALLDGSQLAGARLPDVLARSIDPEIAEVAADFVDTLFNPRVIENLVEKINPLRRVETRGSGRILSFAFTRRLERGVIQGLLVRIEDVTREETLSRDLERQRQAAEERLQLALALTQIEPGALAALVGQLRRASAELRASMRDAPGPPDDCGDALRRALHSAKGDASLLGLQPVASAIHALEGALASADAVRSTEALAQLAEQLDALDGVVRRFAGVRSALAPTPAAGGGAAAPPAPEPLEQTLARAERFVRDLAAELGKSARFVHRVPADLLDGELQGLLRGVLAQLLRNALVHGIEPPTDRRLAGKPEIGTLQLALRRTPGTAGSVEIVFQDDGRGLDLERLAARLRAAGLPASGDIRAAIFLPGVSTAEHADVHAGRGVGLDVVASRVRDAGGTIAVHSAAGRFCAFRIVLPARRPA